MKGLLEKNPEARITLPHLKKHPFFAGISWEDVVNKRLIPPIDVKDFSILGKGNEQDKEEEQFVRLCEKNFGGRRATQNCCTTRTTWRKTST